MFAKIRALAQLESRQYRDIWWWVRRRCDVPTQATAVPYAQLAAPVIWIFVVVSAIEVVVVHILLHPWPIVRWIAFVAGVWSLIWMIGMLASYRVRPHWLDETELRIRCGAVAEISVPLAMIAGVSLQERDLGSSTRVSQLDTDDSGTWCGIGVSGRTNVQLRLTQPVTIHRPGLFATGTVSVDSVGCWVDEPRAVHTLLTKRSSHQ